MTFTVEDGTGVTDANSWADIAFIDAYFADRGIATWTGDETTIKEPAAIRATDYVHTRFGRSWIPVNGDEVDPDVLYTFDGTIPVNLKKAIAEYSLRALSATLAPDPTVDANGLVTVLTKKQLGPLQKQYDLVGNPKATPALLRNYPAADMLLASLVSGGARTMR